MIYLSKHLRHPEKNKGIPFKILRGQYILLCIIGVHGKGSTLGHHVIFTPDLSASFILNSSSL